MMKYLQPTAVLLLMLSIGMSLSFPQVAANWRRLTPSLWDLTAQAQQA